MCVPVLAPLVCTCRPFTYSTRTNRSTPPSQLQEGKLPYDLALESGCSLSLLALLQPGSAAWLDGGEGFGQPDSPLVSAAERQVFESLSHLLDPNPRRLKRIVSVYALVTEVAKLVPLSEGDDKARLAVQIQHWPVPYSLTEGPITNSPHIVSTQVAFLTIVASLPLAWQMCMTTIT